MRPGPDGCDQPGRKVEVVEPAALDVRGQREQAGGPLVDQLDAFLVVDEQQALAHGTEHGAVVLVHPGDLALPEGALSSYGPNGDARAIGHPGHALHAATRRLRSTDVRARAATVRASTARTQSGRSMTSSQVNRRTTQPDAVSSV